MRERVRFVDEVRAMYDDGALVGIVSIGDVVKFHSTEQEVQIRFLTEYISG